jgi:biopolymer transport protein ExbB/TolQ
MKRKSKLVTWLVGGVILALGPLWGWLGTVVGMVMAFGRLAQGEPEVEALARDISFALYTTVAGLVACPIGIAVIIVTVIKLTKTKEDFPNKSIQATPL